MGGDASNSTGDLCKFLTMVRDHGKELKLWHEVSITPAAGQVFEYINCHPGTGLLPYFPSEDCWPSAGGLIFTVIIAS